MLTYTPVEEIAGVVASARTAFNKGTSKQYDWRRNQLKSILQFVKDNKDEIVEALKSDLGRPYQEGYISEVMGTEALIQDMLKNMSSWVQPRGVATPMLQMKGMSTSQIVPEPKGVVLIISPWNYPINLPLAGVATAICAGNCVVLKPSEVSEACSKLITEKLPSFLDADCIKIINGGVKETTEVLKQKFDHIMYTGNGMVGRIVMRAAAEHLTPVTLELGGKSPVIVDKDVDMDAAARRIIWGKCLNAGQTCIAPDYVLVHSDVKEQLINSFKTVLQDFYGSSVADSASFGRIINARQFKRLNDLLNEEKSQNADAVAIGGDVNESSNFISPTVLYPSNMDAPFMKDEIFGPVLPVIPIDSVEQGIQLINDRPKPLALYVFSKNSSVWQNVIDNTSSGGLVVNDTLMHYTVPGLPFGGVGESGIGAYHGQSGFDSLSHLKAVLNKTTWFDLNVRYPPYTESKSKMFNQIASIAK